MSEEKKNIPAQGEEKNKNRPRRHGYFIEPAPAAKQGTAPASQVKAPASQGAASAEQGASPARSEKPHRHPPRHKHNHHKEKPRQPKPEENKTQAQSSEQGTAPSHPKKKNNRNRKNNQGNQVPAAPQVPETQDASRPSYAPEHQKSRPLPKEPRPAIEHSADDYEEYRLEVDEAVQINTPDAEDAPKTEVVGIRFKSTGKVYYFDPVGKKFKRGSYAIVDTARGQEFGEVAMANSTVRTSDIVAPLRAVIRAATTADIEHHAANKEKEEQAFKICNERIVAHGLEMKLIDAQYTFDNTKLLFYFTSADRVDFRELVKDLASVFRTRIELRQIGIRDEAKLMGGLGMCGRPLCCTLFLSDFDQVSIKMAKEQNLSLNSAKISGICGRLMCCLKYEHEAYEYEIRRTPPVDSLVRTENGDGIVTEISPLRGTVKVRLLASPDVPPKVYHRDNVTMLRKKQSADKG